MKGTIQRHLISKLYTPWFRETRYFIMYLTCMYEKNQIEKHRHKTLFLLKINISFISLYILSMSRKKNTILIFNNIPIHKGASRVPFSLLFSHKELYKDVFFYPQQEGCASLNLGNDPLSSQRPLLSSFSFSWHGKYLKSERGLNGFRLFL